ncbi:LuxR C-terminal-related transcriptional regulator [Acinetobacter sp. MB5]|nr:LuxR C-terminal-related transcriptional regulator [Acinetobacter sp. MB5]
MPTVKTHVQHIFQKMQVNSRQQMMSQFLSLD